MRLLLTFPLVRSLKRIFSIVLSLFLFLSFTASAETRTVLVEDFDLSIKSDFEFDEDLDPEAIIRNESYRLSVAEGGIFLPVSEEDGTRKEFRLEDAPKGNYSIEAIGALQGQLVKSLADAGYYGIVVMTSPEQIDPYTGEDLRETDGGLTFDVWFNEVVEVRSVGKGDRLAGKDPVNNKVHRSIRKNSPIKLQAQAESEAPEAGASSPEGVPIRKQALDNYLMRLNRHPGRRVDVALSSAGEPGDVVLDYLVSESKPWLIYGQFSNTGTESTGEWRQRIGAMHYQLTGNDDTLMLDYMTASFDRANAYSASYEFPLFKPDYLKVRGYASFSDFAAENLQNTLQPDLVGETTTFGAELVYTPLYVWDHALSFTAGVKQEDIETDNILGGQGEADLLTPYVQVSLSKNKTAHRSHFSLGYEFNSNTGNDNLLGLGRLASTDDYTMLTFDFQQSFFLEPLFSDFSDASPDNWRANRLVHELVFSARGQFVMDDARVIPQKQIFGGGFFSARGYFESVANADNGIIASAEYRFHLARLLKPTSMLDLDEEASDQRSRDRFNFRAPDLYGSADWNFLMRGFVDYATFEFNDPRVNEVDEDLMSAGIGFELQYKTNLTLRVDYGFVMEEVVDFNGDPIEGAESGDSRVHVLLTLAY